METAAALVGTGPEVARMSENLQDAWIAFIQGSDPWPAYDGERRATRLLGPESRTVENYRGEQLSVWDGRYPAAG
jgi:para-nitrobenzyl esterase